jgi:predicted PurR-regulated permease PerM
VKKRGWPRGAATGVVLFGLAAILLVTVAAMVPLVINQVQQLVTRVPGWLEEASVYTKRWFNIELTGSEILDRLRNADVAVSRIASSLASVGAFMLGLLFQVLTIGLFTFYLVADGPRVRRAVCSVLPPQRQREILDAWEIAIDKTGGFLYSRLLLAAISAFFAFIALMLLGVPFAPPSRSSWRCSLTRGPHSSS